MNHREQVVALLNTQIGNIDEVQDIQSTAMEVAEKWVKPLSGGKESTNGLIYGLVQSGKTGVLTVTGAIGADDGYRTIMILTSDIDPLYEQTLGRAREAFPGIDIIPKQEFKNRDEFLRRVKGGTTAVVATKNAAILTTLIENFKGGGVRGLACLIIDDEADQASLNTKENKATGARSTINKLISELRAFFDKNTYLQVTATPQCLFLQTPGHEFRPKFTVLSHPGQDYVGGEDFFGEGAELVREFDLNDVALLVGGGQPSPPLTCPPSLLKALDVFMIAATFKRLGDPTQNCAFLCHVSTGKADHQHVVDILRKYKSDLATKIRAGDPSVLLRLKSAYEDLAESHAGVRSSDMRALIEAVQFYSPGIAVKLVNGDTDEDVAVRSPYNLFVGGNKLGRGVTIKNLLVSYYGRNPKKPQADTVLQHARMYGYRRQDIGLLRLYLPQELRVVFTAIHKMEQGLRELVARRPDEEFRGVYLEGGLSPTRKNVLAPGAIGAYTGGSVYNPAQVLRDSSVVPSTLQLNKLLQGIADKSYGEFPLQELSALVRLTRPDPLAAEKVWNSDAVAESIVEFGRLRRQEVGYVYVDRKREGKANRHETQGILTGGEADSVPSDKLTLFLLRVETKGGEPSWWPQIRFPKGQYAFAFSV